MGVDEAREAAAEALAQATVAPDRALVMARSALALARSTGSRSAESVAHRAIGVASVHLRDLPASMAALRSALRAARLARSPSLVAEARMSMAATLLFRGRPARAIQEIDLAVTDLDGVEAARALTQRAALLQEIGRDEESLADLRRALPVLRQAGDAQWESRGLSNRAMLLIGRRAFTAAEHDLLTARKLSVDHDLFLQAAYVDHNLGWLYSSKGEVVAALEHLRRAEEAFDAMGMEVGALFADKGELLLSVRLLDEARVAAETAVGAHRAQRRELQVPEAELLLSTVALVQGDHVVALKSAHRAIRGFRRLNRRSGLALAQYARFQSLEAGRSPSVTSAGARKCADDLAAAGWAVPALEARLLAGRLALMRGRVGEARVDLAAAGRARFAGPADARARAWYAEALLRLAEGRRRSARSAVSAGLRVLETHQATLGATELRAHVSLHRGSLAALGLRMAVEDGDAKRVLSFVERGRASAIQLRAARPPDDAFVSDQLADLRTTMSQIEQRRIDGRATTELSQRQVRLERTIAEHCRSTPAGGLRRADLPSISDLATALAETALVEYVEVDGVLHATTLVDGRTRLYELGPADWIGDALPHLSFALRRLANPGVNRRGVEAATNLVRRIGDRLDRLLMAPLAKDLGDRSLVVVPVGMLSSLPWSVLASCVGRPLTVSASATLWHTAAGRPSPAPDARTVAVAGPDLPGAREEAEAVALVHGGSTTLVGSRATVSWVARAMDGAALVHIAAHGRLRSDNPLFSSLLMQDGPLVVYDLERLQVAPHHVVLAACEAARPHMVGKDEVLGLAVALLGQGTVSLVAPVISVVDEATVPLMIDYHTELRSGRSPAAALAAAQQRAAADGSESGACAATFVCMGAGHSRIVSAEPASGGRSGHRLPGGNARGRILVSTAAAGNQ